jgi:hypothetical protein
MANKKFTQLPTVSASTLADIIAAVQGGISTQQTLQQVFNLYLSNTILNHAGNPNGAVAGVTYQFCWDTTNTVLYICTSSGNAATAVWQLAGSIFIPGSSNSSVLGSTSTGVPAWIGPMTNGQVIIGFTGSTPINANLTAGAGISISNGPGTITISGTGSSIGWTEVTGTSQAMVADNGYVANNAGLVTLTLPPTAAFGTVTNVMGKGAGGWLIAQNAGQSIILGSSTTTVGVGGSLASTNYADSIQLICIEADLIFAALGAPQGIITVV